MPISAHLDGGHGQLLQGRHSLLRPIFLGEAQDGVEHHDGQDGYRVFNVAQGQRDHRCDDEDDHQQSRDLLPEDAPRAFGSSLDKLVETVFLQTALDLSTPQTLLQVGLQSRQHVIAIQ